MYPTLDETYRAGDLPPGSVVQIGTCERQYVIARTGLCMKWSQPIPGSDTWTVTYVGRLAEGDDLTPRERAEVDEAGRRLVCNTNCLAPTEARTTEAVDRRSRHDR
jgi:hypothetical protein